MLNFVQIRCGSSYSNAQAGLTPQQRLSSCAFVQIRRGSSYSNTQAGLGLAHTQLCTGTLQQLVLQCTGGTRHPPVWVILHRCPATVRTRCQQCQKRTITTTPTTPLHHTPYSTPTTATRCPLYQTCATILATPTATTHKQGKWYCHYYEAYHCYQHYTCYKPTRHRKLVRTLVQQTLTPHT